MARKKKRRNPHAHALPDEVLVKRRELLRSGAAGVHQDQKARVHRLPSTNRVGSRSAQTRSAVKDSLRGSSRGEFSLAA